LIATITIAADTTIDGSGQTVTISGWNPTLGTTRVFTVNAGVALSVNALTVADGGSFDNAGGILNNGTLIVSNSTFSGNNAFGNGGAIYNDGTLTVSNSTFSGNNTGASDASGGAIFNSGTLTVSNSTFSGNSARTGGGISNYGTGTLKNTIIANSPSGGNCYGAIADGGGNLSYPDTTCPGTNSDPMLGPLQNNLGPTYTMALGPGSAAIDAANDAICAAPPVNNRDQRGIARPQGPHCDIGAYEATLQPITRVFLPMIVR
jgi:predicted outer membrane repeat protein